ncbi:[LysW]-lysine hydrolase [uncultured Thermanaerothrix sp.]|uniref:[LysW]-lysine hydrolase n=1 Tax=uncultured Thermanaerothrix sp. TaxID=1195149 RepID=UPI002603D905|nr:[LysW]-lysine hydrolase [uncultured Thermanaerothrix sp.]
MGGESVLPEARLGTLVGLLRHYSPTGAEAEAVTWLIGRMRALGFTEAVVDEAGNAVGRMGAGPYQVLLLGHIDTVPGEIPLRLEEGRLYGRGAVDAKGPLAAFVDAVAQVGELPGVQWVVIGAVGEEGDSRGARFLLPHYRPQMLIIGEPSGWERLTLGYKGSAWVQVTARRPLAHTAAPVESACEAAVAIWARLKQEVLTFNQERAGAFEQLLATLRRMRSDSDGFEEWAQLQIGLRLPPGLDRMELEALLAMTANGDAWMIEDFIPAYRAEKNTPLVRAFLAAIRAQGGRPSFTLKSGTSDMNLTAPVWGCPTLAYGPGDSSLDHTPHEHIEIEEYFKAVEVLTHALRSLAALVTPGTTSHRSLG